MDYVSWQQMGTPGPPYVQYSGKNCRLIMAELQRMFPGSVNLGIYAYRPVRGGKSWSSHAFEGAGDWGYGRNNAARLAAIDWLILHHVKLHVQMIVDEANNRTWKSSRDSLGGLPGWKDGIVTGGGTWLHYESTPAGWADATPIAQRLTITPPPAPIPTYPPPTSEETVMRLIQPFDDAAVLLQDGVYITWLAGDVVAALVKSGSVANTVFIMDRIGLKGLLLLGPAPTEAAYVGATMPGRTKPTDFAAHRP